VDTGQADELCDVDSVTGASMAIHKQVLDVVGLFDEQFSPFYYEEVDFCLRAKAAGFRVVYQPTSVAIHHESYSFGTRRQQISHDLQLNRLRFVLKHGDPARFLDTFVAAEIAHIKGQISPEYLDGLRQVYLELLLQLAQMDIQPDTFPIYEKGLVRLARTASERRSELLRDYSMNDYWLLQKAEVEERPFTSNTPVVGGLIVWLRTQWNNVAAKWYIRPLLTQQNEYNRLAAQTLADHDGRLLAQDHDQIDLTKQLAEMTMQMKQMNRLLAKYEQRLLTLEGKE
jgi:hypothetical protein